MKQGGMFGVNLTKLCLNEKSYFLGFLIIAMRPPTGGCRGNLIESYKAKRLRSARNDSVTQKLPFSFSH